MVPNEEKKGDYFANSCLSNWKTNSNSKNGWKRCFLLQPKPQYHLSQWGECVYGVESWKEKRLFWEYAFVEIDQRILTLKIMARDVFLMKPNHQYHLSQWEECVYVA